MKKNRDNKKLVLDRNTIVVLDTPDLGRTAGGRMDPTLGICGTSKNTHCPSQLCG